MLQCVKSYFKAGKNGKHHLVYGLEPEVYNIPLLGPLEFLLSILSRLQKYCNIFTLTYDDGNQIWIFLEAI